MAFHLKCFYEYLWFHFTKSNIDAKFRLLPQLHSEEFETAITQQKLKRKQTAITFLAESVFFCLMIRLLKTIGYFYFSFYSSENFTKKYVRNTVRSRAWTIQSLFYASCSFFLKENKKKTWRKIFVFKTGANFKCLCTCSQ